MQGLTFVVQHDSENGDVVALRDPVHAAGHAEQERPVANDLTHELALVSAASLHVTCELDAQSSTAGPSEAAATAVDPRAWDGSLDLVSDETGLRHSLDGPESVPGYGLADFRHEV